MKKIVVLGLIVSLFVACNSSNKKTDKQQDSIVSITPISVEETNSLSDVITKFVRAYVSKDNGKVNALIHPEIGITVIYRPGVADTFVKVDSMDFSKPVPNYYAYPELSNDYVLTYEKLPEFDCGTEKWDKQGFFCDTTSHPLQLSNIAAFEDEFEEGKFSDEDLEQIEKSEQESFRVILTTSEPLIFHVRKYQGKWYVTTLDRAYAGCDA